MLIIGENVHFVYFGSRTQLSGVTGSMFSFSVLRCSGRTGVVCSSVGHKHSGEETVLHVSTTCSSVTLTPRRNHPTSPLPLPLLLLLMVQGPNLVTHLSPWGVGTIVESSSSTPPKPSSEDVKHRTVERLVVSGYMCTQVVRSVIKGLGELRSLEMNLR